MFRKQYTIYIIVALLAIAFLAVLGYTVMNERQDSAALARYREVQEQFNQKLFRTEEDLGLPLRDFTPEEEEQLLRGEREVDDIIADIVAECATPEPVLSGQTFEEVTAEFRIILDTAKSNFKLEMDALIARARVDYLAAVTEDDKEELILEYVEEMAALESRSDSIFSGYIEDLKAALIAVDGSLDETDTAQIEAFQKEYDDEKAVQMARFSKEYNQ